MSSMSYRKQEQLRSVIRAVPLCPHRQAELDAELAQHDTAGRGRYYSPREPFDSGRLPRYCIDCWRARLRTGLSSADWAAMDASVELEGQSAGSLPGFGPPKLTPLPSYRKPRDLDLISRELRRVRKAEDYPSVNGRPFRDGYHVAWTDGSVYWCLPSPIATSPDAAPAPSHNAKLTLLGTLGPAFWAALARVQLAESRSGAVQLAWGSVDADGHPSGLGTAALVLSMGGGSGYHHNDRVECIERDVQGWTPAPGPTPVRRVLLQSRYLWALRGGSWTVHAPVTPGWSLEQPTGCDSQPYWLTRADGACALFIMPMRD